MIGYLREGEPNPRSRRVVRVPAPSSLAHRPADRAGGRDVEGTDDPDLAPAPEAGRHRPGIPGRRAGPGETAPLVPRHGKPRRLTLLVRRPVWRVPSLHGNPVADLAVVILAVIVAISLAIVGWRSVRDGQVLAGVTVSRGRTLAAVPPLGWSSRAVWTSPALLPRSGRILVDDDVAGFITEDRRVAMVDLATGDTRWAQDLPDGDPRTPLVATSVADRDVVAAQVGNRLAWWSRDTGEPGGLDLPTGARPTFLGDIPLIGLDRSTVATIGPDGDLRRYTVPSGAIAYAARADGRVVAASSAGTWHLSPGKSPGAPTPFSPPVAGDVSRPKVVGYAGGHLLTLWPARRPSLHRELAVYSDLEAVRYAFGGPIVEAAPRGSRPGAVPASTGVDGGTLRWSPSPAGTWGILDRTLVDVTDGRVEDLGPWSTRHVAEDRALGEVAGQAAVVGPSLSRGLLRPGESFPEAMTGAGAAVRALDEGHEVVHILPWPG